MFRISIALYKLCAWYSIVTETDVLDFKKGSAVHTALRKFIITASSARGLREEDQVQSFS
jgi:hypothetical protein